MNRDSRRVVLELCLSLHLGGLELYALRAAEQLRSRGFETRLVIRPDGRLASKAGDSEIPIFFMKKRARHFPILAAYRLARIIDDCGADVLHLHWAKDLALASMAKRFANRPVKLIYTRHMALFSARYNAYHRWLYSPVDSMITITDEMRAQVIKYLPLAADRVQRLYLGAPAHSSSTLADCNRMRQELNIAPSAFLVGLFGRIEEPKGQHLLIDALSLLISRGIVLNVAFIGYAMDGQYFERLKQRVAQEGLTPYCHFLGFHHNPTSIMPCFDTIVLTTRYETFGLVLIEAMHAGVPVVGSAAGGVLEIIEDGKSGLYFRTGDARDLAAKLERLQMDPALRTRLARGGLERAHGCFDENVHFDQLAAHILERLRNNNDA